MQKLVKWAERAGRADLADAYVVARSAALARPLARPVALRGRQFCLRFGAEVVGLNARGHSPVFTADEVRAAVCGCAAALRRTRRTAAG